MPTAPDLFDQWAAVPQASPVIDAEPTPEPPPAPEAAPTTPQPLRRALQELLRNGLLEQAAKPQLFRHIASSTARVNALLEPLDLQVRVDDLRGLAYVAVAPGWQAGDAEDDDEWTHPLVRRQRLTLEQSLLLAVLRREFLQREQEGGLGVAVQLGLDGLLPQLEIYLGATGSDMQDRKRLLELLDKLRAHGVVSEVDAQDQLIIRPMIVHLANPENLQGLLAHLRGLGQAGESTP